MNRIISLSLSVIFVGALAGESFRLHLLFTNNISLIKESNFYIVTVLDKKNQKIFL